MRLATGAAVRVDLFGESRIKEGRRSRPAQSCLYSTPPTLPPQFLPILLHLAQALDDEVKTALGQITAESNDQAKMTAGLVNRLAEHGKGAKPLAMAELKALQVEVRCACGVAVVGEAWWRDIRGCVSCQPPLCLPMDSHTG